MTDNATHFYSYLAEGNIICRCKARTGAEVVSELARLLARNNAGLSAESIVSEVLAREAVFPTVIAPGLAVPHARLAELDKPLVALASSRDGIDFQAPETGPVKVVLMLLTPGDDPGLHLQLLSALAKDFSTPGEIDKVADLPDAGAVMAHFNGSDLTIPGLSARARRHDAQGDDRARAGYAAARDRTLRGDRRERNAGSRRRRRPARRRIAA